MMIGQNKSDFLTDYHQHSLSNVESQEANGEKGNLEMFCSSIEMNVSHNSIQYNQ